MQTRYQILAVSLVAASGCYASHRIDPPGVVEDAGLPPCTPGTIELRWISDWEQGEFPGAQTIIENAFHLVYATNGFEDARVDRVDVLGVRSEVVRLGTDREVVAYRWLSWGGEPWLARWDVGTLRVGRWGGDDVTWAFDVPIERSTDHVVALDDARLLVTRGHVDAPRVTATVVDRAGRVERHDTPFPPDRSVFPIPTPDGPPLIVQTNREGDSWIDRAGEFDEASRLLLDEVCEDVLQCSRSLLPLGGEALLLAWRSDTEAFLERQAPGEPTRRVALEGLTRRRHMRRAPPDRVIITSTVPDGPPMLTLVDAGSLATLGEAAIENDGLAFEDGTIPSAREVVHMTDVTDDGVFLAYVRAGESSSGPHRWTLGRVCAP